VTNAEEITLDRVLSAWGARVCDVHQDGTVRFHVVGVPGLASVKETRQRVVSASFFLRLDADREEVEDGVKSTVQPIWPDVQVSDTAAGMEVRVCLELALDYETLKGARILGRRIRMIREAWLRRSSGVTDMLLTLASDGVPCPPLAGMEKSIREYGLWHWGTYPFDSLALVVKPAFEHP
jgi:hypothetical protein